MMKYIQVIYRLYTGYLRVIYGVSTGYLRVIYGLYTGYLRVIYRGAARIERTRAIHTRHSESDPFVVSLPLQKSGDA